MSKFAYYKIGVFKFIFSNYDIDKSIFNVFSFDKCYHAEPKTQWCCPPFYYYSKEDAKRIWEALNDGCGYDAPGSFIAWLCKKTDVYAMEMAGSRYDVGNLESYNKIKSEYKWINK